jgi:hypothetical protein
VNWLEALAEQRIEQAQCESAFDDLPGAGRPLTLDDDRLVPENCASPTEFFATPATFRPRSRRCARSLRSRRASPFRRIRNSTGTPSSRWQCSGRLWMREARRAPWSSSYRLRIVALAASSARTNEPALTREPAPAPPDTAALTSRE